MNKKVLYSLGIIGIITGLTVSGTYAYFTANQKMGANRFMAGTLDLDVSADGNKLEPFVIENIGSDGNVGGTKTWTVKNTGSLPGRLFVGLRDVINLENGCNDQEKAVDPTCDSPEKQGDLGKIVTLNIALDGVDKVNSTLAPDKQQKIGSDWEALSAIILQPNEQKTITAHWAADASSYGNEIQSDETQFNINFRLNQLTTSASSSN
ncbi:MAG: TasA family protein [Candidatus Moraniibacteriota bacterium]